MKKIFNFSVLLFGLAVIGLVSCAPEELSTDQYSDETVALSAFGPNPVMRGAALTILGSNLDKVAEVHLPGIDPITEFDEVVAGAHGSLKVTVPVQAPDDVPAVGVVTIVDQNGQSHSSLTELSYTEAFKIDSFSPAEVHPGDKVTVKGDYLYNVKEVALYKDAENRAYGLDLKVTRKQLTFIVPDDATTGQFIISDVDHNNNPDNLIPNEIFSGKDLKMLDPVVTPFKTKAFKSGQTVTITGEHLGMISKVVFAGAETDELTVSEDRKTLTVALPAKATDGEVTVVTYEGHSFKAGEITTIIPTGLAVAAETRYKAGLNVVVTGKDLDLVTGVKVAEVDAKFTTAEKKTVVVLPAESPDGDVVLSLANGKTVTAGAIEVVKPVIESLSVATIVAGDSLIVKGTDLDLVTAVEISEQPCEFKLEEKDLKVYVSKVAFTGDLVVKAANECSSAAPIEVTYDEKVSIEFITQEVSLGEEIKLEGKNLLLIESISIGGVKVTTFTKREDKALSFLLPDEIVSPDMYNLDLVLVTGEQLTWAIKFKVKADFIMKTIWTGEQYLNWSGMAELAWGGYDWSTVKAGTSIIAYFELDTSIDYWQVRFGNGSWGSLPTGLTFEPNEGNIPMNAGDTSFELTLTQADVDMLVNQGGLVMTGCNYTLKKLVLKIPAAEKLIFDKEVSLSWGEGGQLGLAASYFADVKPGQIMKLYFKQTENWGQVQFNDANWANIVFAELEGPTLNTDNVGKDGKAVTEFELVLTKEILDHILATKGDFFGVNTDHKGDGVCAMIIQGQDWIIQRISIK